MRKKTNFTADYWTDTSNQHQGITIKTWAWSILTLVIFMAMLAGVVWLSELFF